MLAQEIYFVEIVPGRGIMRCAALGEKELDRGLVSSLGALRCARRGGFGAAIY